MIIKNKKIEEKQKFNEQVLFPQLKGNGSGIGDYISYLEAKIESQHFLIDLLKSENETLKKQLKK